MIPMHHTVYKDSGYIWSRRQVVTWQVIQDSP